MPQSLGKNLLAQTLAERNLSAFFRLKREWFIGDEIPIYEWVSRHVSRYGQLPSLSFAIRKNAGLSTTDSEEPFGVWHDQYLERALYNRFDQMMPDLQRRLTARDVGGALDLIVDLVESSHAMRADGERDLITAHELGERVLQELIQARSARGMTGIPTGWPTLDRQTRGWQAGDLYVVLARPKMGKSTVLIKSAKAAHEAGFSPLFVSMEMRATQIGTRLFGMLCGLNMSVLRDGQLTSIGQEMIQDRINLLRSNPVPFHLIEGQFRKDIKDLQAVIHELRPSIVFLDGGYLVKIARMLKSQKHEQMSEIAQDLKTICSTARIPTVVSFQFNREVKRGDSHRAGFEHIQLADAIGQLASVGIGLFDDTDPNVYSAEHRRRMEIIGGRDGEEGGFYINWDWSCCNFDEVVVDEPMAATAVEAEEIEE